MASATIETDPDSTPITPFAAHSATLARIHTTPVNVPTRARSPCARLTIHSTIYIRPHGTTYISIAQTDCSVATLPHRYKKAATHTGHDLGMRHAGLPLCRSIYALASAVLFEVSRESAPSSAACPFAGTTPKQ